MALNVTLNGETRDLQVNDRTVNGIRRIASTGRLVIEDTVGVKPNLCLNSINERTSSSEYLGIDIPSSALKPSTTYTWSFDAKYTGNLANTTIFSAYHQGWPFPDGTYINLMFNIQLYDKITTEYQRFNVTFTTPAVIPTTGSLQMSFYCIYGTGVKPVVRRWKLEENNIASAYLPNDSDTYYWNELTLLGITKQIWTPVTQTQWITNGSRYCSGYTLMEPQKEQSRVCYGSFCTTWSDTGNTRNQVIQTNSPSCGYMPQYSIQVVGHLGWYCISGSSAKAGTTIEFTTGTEAQGKTGSYEIYVNSSLVASGRLQDYLSWNMVMPSKNIVCELRFVED